MNAQSILIVGNPERWHVGGHLLQAAHSLEVEAEVLDIREARSPSKWVNRFYWRLLGKRPPRFRSFGEKVLALCRARNAGICVTTGMAPVSAAVLRELRAGGVKTVNYSTDDPWNPSNAARFFWAALREYDVVATPRRANMEDLVRHGCRLVEYVPFGYAPHVHFPEQAKTADEAARFDCEAAIVGGGDADRIPYARALVEAGVRLYLYGGYWDRFAPLKPCARGFVYEREHRLAIAGGRVQIGMVRKANRDGHSMRSFEVPAMGGCLVTEDTVEHRDLYGPENETVLYFRTVAEMVEKTKRLIREPGEAERLRKAVHAKITNGANRYADRLKTLIELAGS